MPGHPALPVVTNSYAFLLCMRGCGCVGTRHSPRLSHGKAENSGTTRTHSRRENADTRDPHSVIAREGGRSSIAEELMINRQAAAYWIPAFAGMTAGPTTNATCLRMRAQRSNPAFCLASRWIASLRWQ